MKVRSSQETFSKREYTLHIHNTQHCSKNWWFDNFCNSIFQVTTLSFFYSPPDLQNKFSIWDKNGDGLVLYSDLPEFMGARVPPEEALMKFDANNDGKFDLEELLNATGFVWNNNDKDEDTDSSNAE